MLLLSYGGLRKLVPKFASPLTLQLLLQFLLSPVSFGAREDVSSMKNFNEYTPFVQFSLNLASALQTR